MILRQAPDAQGGGECHQVSEQTPCRAATHCHLAVESSCASRAHMHAMMVSGAKSARESPCQSVDRAHLTPCGAHNVRAGRWQRPSATRRSRRRSKCAARRLFVAPSASKPLSVDPTRRESQNEQAQKAAFKDLRRIKAEMNPDHHSRLADAVRQRFRCTGTPVFSSPSASLTYARRFAGAEGVGGEGERQGVAERRAGWLERPNFCRCTVFAHTQKRLGFSARSAFCTFAVSDMMILAALNAVCEHGFVNCRVCSKDYHSPRAGTRRGRDKIAEILGDEDMRA